MNEMPSLDVVAIEAPPVVYHLPAAWEHSHTSEDGAEVFTFERFSVQVAVLLLKAGDGGVDDPDPRLLLAGVSASDDSLLARGPAVLLASGLAMVASLEATEDGMTGHYELCGFHAPGRLAVLRYSARLAEDDLEDPEVVHWLHVFRRLARGTFLLE